MKRFYILSILSILLVFTFLRCGEQETGVPPPELKDRIVYVSEEGICTINPDGTDRKILVSSEQGAPFSNPRWSPEKKSIAFTGHVGKYRKIMLAKSDGSKLDTLGLIKTSKSKKSKKNFPDVQVSRVEQRDYAIHFECWSPVGKYLLTHPIVGLDISAFGLMDKKGKMIAQVGGSSPAFLGNNTIVYVVSYGGITTVGTDIYSIPVDGGEKQNLTKDGTLSYFSPVGSPNGGKIAFGFEGGNKLIELWIMDAAGSNRKKLASNDKDFEGSPLTVITFSPDGQKILFLAKKNHRGSIYVLNVDGTNLHTVVSKIAGATSGVCWSPDSEKILFASDKDGNLELYTINVDGTGLKRLTNNHIKDCCPDW